MINYIIKTLLKENSVDINGLGNFSTQLKHASINGDTITPPFYEIVFTQNQDPANNFSLANTISSESQCLFTEANEQIIKWKDELITALQNNKSVSFEDFGTFMLDKKETSHSKAL